MRPSPARRDAPEPDAWLPIDLTAEVAAFDPAAELELLNLEAGRVDLDRELEALEEGFWRSAAVAHPFLTGELPVLAPVPGPVPTPGEAPAPPGPEAAGDLDPVAPAPDELDVLPAAYVESVSPPDPAPFTVHTESAPTRPAIARHRRALRTRKRVFGAVAIVIVAALASAFGAQLLVQQQPLRDVHVTVDGASVSVVTRERTVADLLAARGITLHPGDRVVPGLSTSLRQGLPVRVVRSFPVTVDVDGTVTPLRTTNRSIAGIRRQLELPAAMVAVAPPERVARDARLVFRTPLDVTLVADGETHALTKQTALTVGELLAAQGIAVDGDDQIEPGLDARLTPGATVTVYRLDADQVAEDKIVPFPTEVRDDPNLSAGHTRTIRNGENGLDRVISRVVRKDGAIVEWTEVGRVHVKAPVTRVVARGTKRASGGTPVAPPAPSTGGSVYQSGIATWYDSHAGSGSCAHLRLPFGTLVKVVASNGRSAYCRVGDRGPQAWTGRIIDLNRDVFAQLAPLGTGTLSVKLIIAG